MNQKLIIRNFKRNIHSLVFRTQRNGSVPVNLSYIWESYRICFYLLFEWEKKEEREAIFFQPFLYNFNISNHTYTIQEMEKLCLRQRIIDYSYEDLKEKMKGM